MLAGKVVLVSGGSSGVGAAISLAAGAAGAEAVVLTGRNERAAREVTAALDEHGVKNLFLRTDLTDVAQARASVADTITAFGRVDCVVNAAGLTSRGTMLDTDPELFDQHVAVNLKSPWFIMADTIRHLKGRGAPGSIVNVISISELGGYDFLAPYVAAKSGLAGATRNAAHAHRWDRIRINGLDIGWTATAAEDAIQRSGHGAGDDWLEQADASVPMGKINRPDDLAEMVVFLLSDRSGVVTGSVIDWDQTVQGGQG
ncbi:SDR family oxidoreductase [Kineococcus sp. SYSU DK003]|uniref:SDR family oxidoreductase n=1 Tax=Kineococcus sp. SYSU DK003 TaxID=3383124 RepID=UPI003D7DD363